MIIIALGQLFTEAGFGPAVVQREDLTDEHIRTAFALSLFTGAVMTALTFFAAPLLGDFFHSPGLPPIVRGLSFVFMLQAPGVVAMAMLQRDLDFKSIAIAETGVVLLRLRRGRGDPGPRRRRRLGDRDRPARAGGAPDRHPT